MTIRRPMRMCVHCDRFTTTPVLVSQVHSGSGAGINVYACPECAPLCPRMPDALDLLVTGRNNQVLATRAGQEAVDL
ncbi:hypothetical protein [Streptomyces gobitricini]|uniref:Uncharacterized protein n=1 Tax=Streptomyces gobitricini TaxID=68211 RepID=A0ABN3M795_9ACTN